VGDTGAPGSKSETVRIVSVDQNSRILRLPPTPRVPNAESGGRAERARWHRAFRDRERLSARWLSF
jgi:hypothetical protein